MKILVRILGIINSLLMALWVILFVDYNTDGDFDLPVEEVDWENRKKKKGELDE